jgi:capsular polysaccharide transport system permease protein
MSVTKSSKETDPAKDAETRPDQKLRAVSGSSTIQPEKMKRRRSHARDFVLAGLILLVGLPTLLGSLYFGLLASDRYVSTAKIVVKTDNSAGASSEFAAILGLGKTTSEETELLAEYIQSTTMALDLDRLVGLRQLWSNDDIDLLSRLANDASNEEYFDYYLSRVSVETSKGDSVVSMHVQAFNPENARLILGTIIEQSQIVLEDIFEEKRRDAITFAEGELAKAEDRLASVQTRLEEFRHDHNEIDPIGSATQVGQIAGGIETNLAQQRSQLGAMLSYMQEDNPAVFAQRALIASLERQLEFERSRLVNRETSDYSELVGSYQNLLVEQGFAEAAYTAALGFLTTTRQDLQRRHAYLINLSPPTLPDEAVLPKRLWSIATVFVLSLLTFGILVLVVGSIREHARN